MLLVVFSQGMNNGCRDVALRRLKWIYTRIYLSLGSNSSSRSGSHPTICYVAPTVLARTHNYALWIYYVTYVQWHARPCVSTRRG